MWRPIQEQHAIVAVGAVIQFREELSQRVLRKVVATAEEAAFAQGLRSRSRTNSLQVQIGELGRAEKIETPAGGYMFTSLSRAGDDESVPDTVSEQLVLESHRVLYRTMIYPSWGKVVDKLKTLFVPAVRIALEVAAPQSYRLEYLDRFWFDGDPEDALAEQLLTTESKFLPPHIFGSRTQWHVHTGSYVGLNQVLQINADCIDRDDIVGVDTPRRSVNLVTALEQRFPSDEASDGLTAEDVLDGFIQMHGDLKNVLRDIISPEMSEAIHLDGSA
jgi:uncharacterized protein (TIGR04255 family)